MKIKDLMTKKVVTVKPIDTITSVVKLFVKHNVSGVPVVDNKKKVLGIVTEEDVIKAIDVYFPRMHVDTESSFGLILAVLKGKGDIEEISKNINVMNIRVKDFMNHPVITLRPEEDVIKAAGIMCKYKINRIPIVKNNKLVGILARSDIIKALTK